MASFRWTMSTVFTTILAFSVSATAVPFHRDRPWRHPGYGFTRPSTTTPPSDTPSTGSGSGSDSSSNSTPTPSPDNASTTTTGIWSPTPGTPWQIILSTPLTETDITPSPNIPIYDIDLFDNPASTITSLHSSHKKKAICYFSAGTSESWRPDFPLFTDSDKGAALDAWAGENWLDVRSSNVRDIMGRRLDLAKEKGCDGVDPDNVDAYSNDGGGLGLSEDDSVEYVMWLAGEAHARGMGIGLKNAGDILERVAGDVQWAVNEQCVEYEECGLYEGFVRAGKPVFHIEYPGGEEDDDDDGVSVSSARKESVCNGVGVEGFSTVMKKMDLDEWVQTC